MASCDGAVRWRCGVALCSGVAFPCRSGVAREWRSGVSRRGSGVNQWRLVLRLDLVSSVRLNRLYNLTRLD
jgi:hypothetical protein